jgi:hypothetical protein
MDQFFKSYLIKSKLKHPVACRVNSQATGCFDLKILFSTSLAGSFRPCKRIIGEVKNKGLGSSQQARISAPATGWKRRFLRERGYTPYACSVVASPERPGTESNRSQKYKRTIISRKEEIRCKKLSATKSAGRSLKSKLPSAERNRSMTKWCGSSAQKPSQMLTKTTKHGIIRTVTCLSCVHYRRNEP